MPKKSPIEGYRPNQELEKDCWVKLNDKWFEIVVKNNRDLFLCEKRCVFCRDGKNLEKRDDKDLLLHLANTHSSRIKFSFANPRKTKDKNSDVTLPVVVYDQLVLEQECRKLRSELEKWLIDYNLNINGKSLQSFEHYLTSEELTVKTFTRLTTRLSDQLKNRGFCVIKLPSELKCQTILHHSDLGHFKIPIVSNLKVGGSLGNLGIFHIEEKRLPLKPEISLKTFFNRNKPINLEVSNEENLFRYLRNIENRDTLEYGIGLEGHLQRTEIFNLADLRDDEENVLSRAKEHLGSGLSIPSLLIGTQGSVFPLHTEDEDLLSVNIHLFGAQKIWHIVPPNEYDKIIEQMTTAIQHEYPACSNPLRHKTIFVNTDWFKIRNIPFEIVHQNPGDMVIISARSFHQGFNAGNNIAEAVNFADTDWLENVFKQGTRYCT